MSWTLCTLNCNGLRSAGRKGFERWLQEKRPDLLYLQEIRARPDQVPPAIRCPEGYNTRWVPAERPGYSGVAIYSRPPADRYSPGTGLDWGDREGRVLRADFGPLVTASVYVPSGTSSAERQAAKMGWLEHFAGWAGRLLAEGRSTAICGDVNIAHTEIDIHDPRGNADSSGFLPEERAWMSALLDQGWVDVLRSLHPGEPGIYSWWSNRGRARERDHGWRIDYVLCTPDLAATAEEAWVEKDAGLSDHAPVWIRFRGSPPTPRSR